MLARTDDCADGAAMRYDPVELWVKIQYSGIYDPHIPYPTNPNQRGPGCPPRRFKKRKKEKPNKQTNKQSDDAAHGCSLQSISVIAISIHLVLVHEVPFPRRQLAQLLPRCHPRRLDRGGGGVRQGRSVELGERAAEDVGVDS